MKHTIVRTVAACACFLMGAALVRAQSALSPTPPVPSLPNVGASESPPVPPVPPANDVTSILRFDPFQNKLLPTPESAIKPGYLYNHYNAALGRRVWSLAQPGGGFLYAMGAGSTQPASRLDLQGTPEQRARLVQSVAPTLAEMIRRQGGAVYIRLNAQDQWEIVPFSTIASVFDLTDGRRWEWHGDRRVSVLHTYGDDWQLVEGRYTPASVGAWGQWEHCAY